MTDTEIKITADLVRDLLQEQHPDLAGLAIREVARPNVAPRGRLTHASLLDLYGLSRFRSGILSGRFTVLPTS
jgi:hypothetical protein